MCTRFGCPNEKEPMKYIDLLKHAEICIKKKTLCPIGCGMTLSSHFGENAENHYKRCKDAL